MAVDDIPRFARTDLESFFSSAAAHIASANAPNEPPKFSHSHLITAFARLGGQLAEHRQECAAKRRAFATEFNVFDFINPSENVLSNILQFFLDPEASHGQGGDFLRILLARVRPDLELDCAQASVVREARTYSIKLHRRRIDLLATIPTFTLAIENKKFTGEGRAQIQDYTQHLRNIAGQRFCLIFLTRTGAEASSITPELAAGMKRDRQLLSWSWEKDVPAWLAECAAACQAAKVRHFVDDFAGYIKQYLAITGDLPNEYEDQ